MKRFIILLLTVIVTVTITFATSPKKKSKRMQNCNKIGVQKIKAYSNNYYWIKTYSKKHPESKKYIDLDAVRFRNSYAQYLNKDGYLPIKQVETKHHHSREPHPKF